MKKTSITMMKKLKLSKSQIIALTADQSNHVLGGGDVPASSYCHTSGIKVCTQLASSYPTREASRVCA
jgi:hypothetical protein